MNFSPAVPTEKQKAEGKHVRCIPNPAEDLDVSQVQHRVVCLMRPYAYCAFCEHRNFKLTFDTNTDTRNHQVACPRWNNPQDRLDGKAPDYYIPVKLSICDQQPYEFCPTCPTRKDLAELGLDKDRPGWYGRWRRFTHEENDDE